MTCPAHALAADNKMLEQEDVDLILDICAKMPKGGRVLVADIGAGVGTTALAALVGLADCMVISVDTDGNSIASARRIAKEMGRALDWMGHVATAVEVAGWYADDSIDLLMLDTLHYYETTRAELEAWLPKTCGVIWVHDYEGEHDGVRRAVDALVSEGRMRETERRGLSWVGVRA